MKNNSVGVWLFLLALIAVGVASTGEVSERINTWLGKQADPVMADSQAAGEAGTQSEAEDAADTQAAETEEAAAPTEEETAQTPSDDEAAQATAETETPETAEPEASETGGEQAATAEEGAGEDAAAPAGETAEPQAEAAEDAAGASAEADVQAEIVVPSFGLLRVEPDGSSLIAGSAGPNADIEILTRSETIATAKAEVNGDFVAVLDDPLEPGDYEIVLRSTEEDGDVAMSEETAIVSVPEPGREGELLALVERPGAPSRLINTPEPEEGKAAEAPQGDMAEAEAPEAQTETAMSEPAAEETAQGAGGTEAAAEEAETASAEAAESASSGDVAEVAEASSEPAGETAAPSSAAARITIRIEAVEIDSDTIFVAGAADPGAQVRVYANEFLLGDTVTSPGGRFLVQVRKDLAVGDYIIRADVIDPATADVVARAAVPFERSEGARVSAVADNAATVEQPAEAGESAEPAGSATAQTGSEAPSAEPSPGQAQPGTIADAEPEVEASMAMDKTSAGTEEASTAETEMAKAEQRAKAAATETAKAAATEAASSEASAEPAATEQSGSGDITAAEAEAPAGEPAGEAAEASVPSADTAEMPSAEASAPSADMTEMPSAEASAGGDEQVASAPETSAPPEVSEDITVTGKLRQTNSSVIIRRGDTLWHISRRVYGEGTRYTTIYLANQDQIKDPDMIWPGQIFELPENAKPEN